MVGVTPTQAQIILSVTTFLHGAVRRSRCHVFADDVKIRIETTTEERVSHPDVQVTCTEETATHCNRRPSVIVETLSPHTERIGRTEKLAAYQLIESLQEYVLVSQDRHEGEVYRRADGWRPEYLSDGDSLSLSSIGVEVPVADIYA